MMKLLIDEIAAAAYPDTSRGSLASRAECVEVLTAAWEEGDGETGQNDPLYYALIDARADLDEAAGRLRRLIAYGREFVQPRSYSLADLADAAEMSPSGAKTAYGHHDIVAVAKATGGTPRDWRRPDPESTPDTTEE